MNADEIVRVLRSYSQSLVGYKLGCEFADAVENGASLIESLQAQLTASQRRERAAVEDLEWLAGTTVDSLRCNICKYNPNDMGCELDGSQFDDDGECRFTWRGPQEAGKGESE